ncbi:hypothetical protein GCM10023191_063360 [Actinoallomurus oryzae]|uniref:Uncharacterized protein n=1 Tax=Actinoallomurus oryzae TaxID=502180 RepID=A0ABP8QMB6_9ACTN
MFPGYRVVFSAGRRTCRVFVRAPRPLIADIEDRARRALTVATCLPASWWDLQSVVAEETWKFIYLRRYDDDDWTVL